MVIRVVPNETVPAAVYRFLSRDEMQTAVISVRRHPMVVALCALPLLADLADCTLRATGLVHGSARALHILVILIAPCACLLLLSIAAWLSYYFVVTEERMFIISWWRYRRPLEIPLSAAADMSFTRTVLGRLLGYGSFRVRRPESWRRVRTIYFLPYPEQLYLEVCGLIFHAPGIPTEGSGVQRDNPAAPAKDHWRP
jgi:hypothetical protein